jgi:hypothetical protein
MVILTRTTILIILLSFTNLTFGQNNCDTISTDIIKQFDNYSQKKFNKIKEQEKSIHYMTIFNIATYFRQKQDTSYKEWYQMFIDMIGAGYDRKFRDTPPKGSFYFTIGKAYYFIDNFVTADVWFQKARKANCTDSCLEYYLELTQNRLK